MLKKRKKTYKKNRTKNRLGCFFLLLLIFAIITFLIYLSQKFEINISKKGKIPSKEKKIEKEKEKKKEEVKESKVSVLEQIETTLKNKLWIKDYKLIKINNKKYNFSIKVEEEEQSIIFVYSVLKGAIELIDGKIDFTKESSKDNKIQMKVFDENQNEIDIFISYKEKKQGKPKKIFAIIIDDFGYYKSALLDKFLNLDKKIVFAIIPSLSYSKDIMQKAKDNQRKTIIHMPMEPLSYPKDNPGENALFVNMSKSKIKQLVDSYTEELPYCLGANNHMGSLATVDEKTMNAVLEVLKEKNMFFIDSRTNSASIAYDIAKEKMISTVKRDIFLDVPDESKKNVEDKIKYILGRESQDKFLIITHCSNEKKLNSLKYFLKRMKEIGFTLVDIEDILE